MGSDLGLLESHDGAATTDYVSGAGVAIGAPLLLATGASPTTVLAGGLLAVGMSRDFGATFEPTPVAPEVPVGNTTVSSVTTQDIKFETASGLFGVAGPINGMGSVAVSSDDGSSWTVKQIATEPPLITPTSIRYASFPSAKIWYATAGFWGDDQVEVPQGAHRISRAFTAVRGADGKVQIIENENENENESKNEKKGATSSLRGSSSSEKKKVKESGDGDGDYTGAWASVVKTTDGGETWSVVYNSTAPAGGYYPNDIHCFDESSCAFALDGSLSQPSQILTTTDGGATWATYSTDQASTVMPVRMVGKTEAWAGGGDVTGQLWHTTDLKTWDKQGTAVNDAFFLSSFALDPAAGAFAYATGFLRSQLCSVLKITF